MRGGVRVGVGGEGMVGVRVWWGVRVRCGWG